MSRPLQRYLVVLAITLTCRAASAAEPKLLIITINIFNDAGVPDSALETAKHETSRIFTAAHLQIRWNDCMTTPSVPAGSSCRDLRAAANELNARIVPAGKRQNEDIFGVAFLGADGTGKYSDIFYDSVEMLRTQRPINIGRLLGHVMAHELGHLLIGSHAHSPWGLMCAKWHAQELRRMEMGTLFFTPEQEQLIHMRLNRVRPEITNMESEPIFRIAGEVKRIAVSLT